MSGASVFRQAMALLLCLAPAAAQAAAPAVQNPFQPFDRARFEADARALGATEAQLVRFGSEIDEFGLARAGDRLVRAVVPSYDAAAKLYEAADPSAALELTKVLAASEAPLLRAHLRYTLSRLFRDSDDPERAVAVLGDYLQNDVNRSPLDAEATFFYAQALADVPRPELAIPRFRAFLQWFPSASERYRSAALQQIADLERQRESRLHQLADGMSRTRRDLKKGKTDEPVQVEQQKHLTELEQLIEMFQEMENQQSGTASGNTKTQAPADQSALPGGEATVGTLQKRPSLADRWGDMKDAEREKIESEVQNNLPPQYRKMLEEYYKKLGRTQRP
jgi:hypothetical protein